MGEVCLSLLKSSHASLLSGPGGVECLGGRHIRAEELLCHREHAFIRSQHSERAPKSPASPSEMCQRVQKTVCLGTMEIELVTYIFFFLLGTFSVDQTDLEITEVCRPLPSRVLGSAWLLGPKCSTTQD